MARNRTAKPTGGSQPYTVLGEPVRDIPVGISYRIIELFSANMYKSPNKAIEELVSNSWDADAQHVWLSFPANLRSPDASIWVVDDGESMDIDELVELWEIARSPKESFRDDPSRERAPIGKFGIGKLSTYLLARKLTYVCNKGGRVLAVTMDYDRIDRTGSQQTVKLKVRQLDEDQVEPALTPLRSLPGGEIVDELIDTAFDDEATWTVATMSDLKPMATNVQIGRVRWLLTTALPHSPGFEIVLNDKKVPSRIATGVKALKSWKVGDTKKHLPDGITVVDGVRAVEVDGLPGTVTGELEIYEDVLTKNKASEWGRSHGFFVRVRGRLINSDDELFGIPALSHQAFNRFRMIVDADGLDAFIASTRETVQDSPEVALFQELLKAEFNRARAWLTNWLEEQEHQTKLSSRIDRTPASLSRRPLVAAVRGLVGGTIDALQLIQRPADDVDAEAVVRGLEEAIEDDEESVIEDVIFEALGTDRPIAVYDPVDRLVRVNILHPFFSNYIEILGRTEPFKLIAVTEVLTEAYLVEAEGPELAAEIISRRDAFLRELVSQNRLGPAVIAENLRAKENDSTGLEEAVCEAMESLGYAVSPIGGSGTPDGVAKAVIGMQGSGRNDYSITFDAKSSGKKAVQAGTVNAGRLNRHRQDYHAQYALVVAPGFEGAADPESALAKECRKYGITPITCRDLALLVEIQAGQMLGYTRLRDLFDTCRTPAESAAWVRALLDEPDETPPLEHLLEVIENLRGYDRPIRLSSIALKLEEDHGIVLSEAQVKELVATLASLARGFVWVQGKDTVVLDTTPEKVRAVIARHYHDLPSSIRSAYIEKHLPDESAAKRTVRRRRPTKA